MAHPSSPRGVRFGGGAVTLGVALLCLLTSLVAAPAAAAPTPVPAGPSTAASAGTPQPAAPSTSYKLQPDEFSVMISPTRLVVSAADAGKSQAISVINRGQAPVPVTVQKRNFTAARDGSLQFDPKSPYGADSWVALTPVKFVLQPGATQVVTAHITTPGQVESGEHEVAVVFLVPSKGGKGNIKVNRGLAAPLYVTAPGPTDDTVALTGLHAAGFTAGGPVDLTATLQSTGTVHRDFRSGTALQVHAAGSPTAFPDFTVLRGATRDVSTQWRPPLACICHLRVTFANAGGVEQSRTVRVIVFPWPYAVGLLGVVLAFLLLRRHRRHRRHRSAARRVVGARALAGSGDG